MDEKYFKYHDTYIKLNAKRYIIVSDCEGVALSVTRANFTGALNYEWGDMILPENQINKRVFDEARDRVLLKLIRYN